MAALATVKSSASRQLLDLIEFWEDEFREESDPATFAACVSTFQFVDGVDDPVEFCQYLGGEATEPQANSNGRRESRAAIQPHGTSTSGESWDAGENVKRLGDSPGKAPLQKMFAWYDSNADPEAKGSYKFPHHLVSSNGSVGAASLKACSSAIGVLNGGRGGADIPEGDRAGVYDHLARHLRDGGQEPPELDSQRTQRLSNRLRITRRMPVSVRRLERGVEQWAFPTEVRVKRNDSNTEATIDGHASVFDSMSEDLGGFFEIVRAGAFKKTIQENDVRALWNHNPDVVLGRNRNDTLKMAEDRKGLHYEARADLANPAVLPVVMFIERGDVDQCSFSFTPIRDRWGNSDEGGAVLRELLEVRLWDVSPVTFPAYTATDVMVRSLMDLPVEEGQFQMRDLMPALQRRAHGIALRPEDHEAIARARAIFDQLAGTPSGDTHLPDRVTQRSGLTLAQLRRRAEAVGHDV